MQKENTTNKGGNLDQPNVKKSLLKWGAVKTWLYEFWHGHPFLLEEEVKIIVQTRLYDKQWQWMNDIGIQDLVKTRVKEMYKKKFPNAKWCRLFPI